MAVATRGRSELLRVPNKWNKESEISPDRTKVWTEPNKNQQLKNIERRVVPVVYYLCRNGLLEHPHFMEVPLASSEGLFLRDVISRLSFLRGKGMANRYSWSSKRSYKSGYVWHDLEENDFVHPVHGQEYVLKGSEIPDTPPISETAVSSSSIFKKPLEIKKPDEAELQPQVFPARSHHRRNQSWSCNIDHHEYRVYRTDTTAESARKSSATDASTQTDDRRQQRRRSTKADDEENIKKPEKGGVREKGGLDGEQSTVLCAEEISPPPSDSSPETLESLMKADGRKSISTVDDGEHERDHDDEEMRYCPSGRMRASSVLMSLISCGSISFRDCGVATVTSTANANTTGEVLDHAPPSISEQGKPKLPRVWNREVDEAAARRGSRHGEGKAGAEEEAAEYFSGSLLMETNKDEFRLLRRTSSYNADRSLNITSSAEDIEGVRTKCIPRKPRARPAEKQFTSTHKA